MEKEVLSLGLMRTVLLVRVVVRVVVEPIGVALIVALIVLGSVALSEVVAVLIQTRVIIILLVENTADMFFERLKQAS